jgi:hypothetical protein
MSDILKEAIADAKAVRETALQNAKMALEEAFAPKLQSMLSAKLREQDPLDPMADEDDELEPGMEPEIDPMADEDDEMELAPEPALDPVTGEPAVEDDELDPAIEQEMEPEDMIAAQDEVPGGDEPAPEVIDINGIKYEKMHVEDEHEMEVEGVDDPDGSGQETLDLESIIKELESELNEEDDAYPEDVDGDVNKEQPPEEMGSTSKISEADDAYPEDVENKEDPEHVGDKDTGVGNTPAMVAENDDAEKEEDDDEDMTEGEDAEKEEDDSEELKEYKAAVRFLKAKLHEVNILNAKLLFTNKLFKEFALDNSQKLRVVETFDRAQSTREIKLVYATLAESFSDKTVPNRKSKLKESASAKAGSTRRKTEIITEERQVADRFRKLAGIIK